MALCRTVAPGSTTAPATRQRRAPLRRLAAVRRMARREPRSRTALSEGLCHPSPATAAVAGGEAADRGRTEWRGDCRHCADTGAAGRAAGPDAAWRSEEHTSELQSLMRTSYAVFCF